MELLADATLDTFRMEMVNVKSVLNLLVNAPPVQKLDAHLVLEIML